MTILERVSTLIRANINDLIDRAGDPEKVIKQLLLDMHSQLAQVKAEVAAAIADEKQPQQRYQENQDRATEWQQKAELAVQQARTTWPARRCCGAMRSSRPPTASSSRRTSRPARSRS